MREYLQPDNISLLAQKTNIPPSTMAKPLLHNFLTPVASAKHRPPDRDNILAAAPQPRIPAPHTKQLPPNSQPEPPTPPPPNPPIQHQSPSPQRTQPPCLPPQRRRDTAEPPHPHSQQSPHTQPHPSAELPPHFAPA